MLTEIVKADRLPAGYQQVNVGAVAVGLTVPKGVTRAVCQVDTNPLRYRDDGTAPTTSVGLQIGTGGIFELLSRKSLQQFRAIQVSGASVLNVLYYK